MKFAIVDLGSNTIRLSVYNTLPEGGFDLLFSEKEMAGLVSYVHGGVLSPEGIQRACGAIRDFQALLRQFDLDAPHVFATASLRNIRNTEEAVEQIRAATGVGVAIRVSFDVPGWIVGVIFAVIMAVVLVGGIKSISSFAEKVVPLMALAYVIGSIFILVKFGSNIPHVFAMIFEYAFTPMAATGGFAGSTVMLAIRWGLARGVYSNEAGTGMAPLAHSSSSANHPVKQGLWGISEVFVDTIIVCTMTALVVLCTGVWTEGGTGAALTATAFGAGFGNAIAGTVFVVAIITFFAFTTALVNVYYGEICMTVLGGKKFILPYRLLGCAFAIIGSVGALSVLWNLFDFFFGVCAVCNLVVCFLMRKQIGALINDYLTRLKSGKWEPTSEAAANAIPELWVNDKAAK